MLPGALRNPGQPPGVIAGMRIDIWSDVVCPFCWIGKRHLEKALETFRTNHPDTEVEVVWRAYELDPDAVPVEAESSAELLARKYGMTLAEAEAGQEQMSERFRELGLDFDWRNIKRGSTFDAHRLAALAADHGVADAVDEALRHAHFSAGKALSDPEVLRQIGMEAGIPGEAVGTMITGNSYADRVREDVEAARGIGVQGVPFFVFGGRLAVSGAQPVDVFRQALEQALEGTTPVE